MNFCGYRVAYAGVIHTIHNTMDFLLVQWKPKSKVWLSFSDSGWIITFSTPLVFLQLCLKMCKILDLKLTTCSWAEFFSLFTHHIIKRLNKSLQKMRKVLHKSFKKFFFGCIVKCMYCISLPFSAVSKIPLQLLQSLFKHQTQIGGSTCVVSVWEREREDIFILSERFFIHDRLCELKVKA